jgi:lipoate-protein ligase A
MHGKIERTPRRNSSRPDFAHEEKPQMHGEYKMPGGKLVVIDLDVLEGRLARVQLSGDFFLEPDSALDTIDLALDGQSADASELALADAVRAALPTDVMMYGLSPEAIAVAVRRALHREPKE